MTGRGRRTGDSGQASVELVGFLPLMLLVVTLVFQVLYIAASVSSAENAARSAARASTLGSDPHAAAHDSVSGWLRSGVHTHRRPGRYEVEIEIPIIFPGLSSALFTVTRDASFPGGS